MKTSQILTITAGTLLAAGVGYAVYFDYKRQNDPSFRKKLKKDSKKTSKAAKKQQQMDKKRIQEAITEVVKSVQQPGALPTDPEAREKFFMEQVTAGETLITLGPSQHLAAATAFFKGIKIYPNPVDLIMIYQKATPEPVFNLIMEMVGKDAELGGGRGPAGPSSDPLAALSGLAASAPSSGGQSLNLDEIDDAPSSDPDAGPEPLSTSEAEGSGPPSQTSSQEWDKLSATSIGQSQADITTASPTSAEASSAEEAGAGEETQDSGSPAAEGESTASTATPNTTAAEAAPAAGEKKEETTQPEGQSPLPEAKSEEEQKAFDFSTGSYTPSPLFKPEGQVEKEQGEAADASAEAAASSAPAAETEAN